MERKPETVYARLHYLMSQSPLDDEMGDYIWRWYERSGDELKHQIDIAFLALCGYTVAELHDDDRFNDLFQNNESKE